MLNTAFLTIHLIGLAIGLGGATIADLAILRSLVRRQPVPAELIRDLSLAIWLGLAILTLSGLALFAFNPSLYVHLSGFIAKMIVVVILVINGILLQRRVHRFRPSPLMLLGGAISAVSWYGALTIAMYKSKLGFNVADYLALYALAVVLVWRMYASMFAKYVPSPVPEDLEVVENHSDSSAAA
jgi:hypothetical protein